MKRGPLRSELTEQLRALEVGEGVTVQYDGDSVELNRIHKTLSRLRRAKLNPPRLFANLNDGKAVKIWRFT